MRGKHAAQWHEDNEDLDEFRGRQEDREQWGHGVDELGLAPRVAASHLSMVHPVGQAEPEAWVPEEETPGQVPVSEVKPTLAIIVVGSFAWTNEGAVTDALHALWKDHGEPNVQLVTSGCPGGAEMFARQFAQGLEWEVANVRDESLGDLASALVLGFVVPKTTYEPVGVDDLLEWLSHRYWTRIYREETIRQTSPWAKR